MIREPAVAGQFYPRHAEALQQQVEEALGEAQEQVPALGVVSPHAGYVYSGAVAGAVLSRVHIPKQVIILGPNHTGYGEYAAVYASGAWSTPLGQVPIATDLAKQLVSYFPDLSSDTEAHRREHSLEVQVPFLQRLRSDVEILPLCLSHLSLKLCEELGAALARLCQDQAEPPLLLASSDMNHYESQEVTLAKDGMAIAAIQDLDPESLYRVVHEENISMCGIIPVTTLLFAVRALGASQAKLIAHTTSGDVNHDYSAVVGYAGFVIT